MIYLSADGHLSQLTSSHFNFLTVKFNVLIVKSPSHPSTGNVNNRYPKNIVMCTDND